MSKTEHILAVLPAAGAGLRMGVQTPKQYLELAGKAILQHSVEAMLALPRVSSAVVVLADSDTRFDALPAARHPRVRRVQGGGTRAQSVAAGVAAVRAAHGDEAWVLVHDAARPLVHPDDVNRLLDSVLGGAGGGILAAPVTDTIKRATSASLILETVARDALWSAQTPQLFRAGALGDALLDAFAHACDDRITDEASAMERVGHACLLVRAHSANPKITHADDLLVAEALLSARDCGAAHAHR